MGNANGKIRIYRALHPLLVAVPTIDPMFVRRHGLSHTSTHQIWSAMKQRCLNPKSVSYARYGGRGIKVCTKWLRFEGFLDDMGMRPPGHSLERINNNGDYCIENCKWATSKDQSRNTSRNIVHVLEDGVARVEADCCDMFGLSRSIVYKRRRRGWNFDDLFVASKRRKLTPDQVAKIRSSKNTTLATAGIFGISKSLVSAIRLRQCYADLS